MNRRHNQGSDHGEIVLNNHHHGHGGGYQSTKSNKSYASGNEQQKKKAAAMGSVDGLQKKKTLHINDYKQFKKIRNIEDRYQMEQTLG
mmetsp:Transcript_38977/g.59264  ORF Transcript_38977/g.59264 Transcript_38977/m.59264 type:complete len:88 (+) Transcript_38977:708-971(+)